MTATVLKHHEKGVSGNPSICVTIVAGDGDVSLRISDQGLNLYSAPFPSVLTLFQVEDCLLSEALSANPQTYSPFRTYATHPASKDPA
jgi:hypothetical protein